MIKKGSVRLHWRTEPFFVHGYFSSNHILVQSNLDELPGLWYSIHSIRRPARAGCNILRTGDAHDDQDQDPEDA